MLTFLKQCRHLLNLQTRICFVLGNESCDLDSAVSAIALAFFYTKTKHTYHSTETIGFLPILNIPRKFFPIKTEVSYFLGKHGISEEHMVFKDDLNESLIKNNYFVLVDHHVSPYRNSVMEVFDHRPYDVACNLSMTCKKTIVQAGSCATLIANNILNSKETDGELKIALKLLYAAIVLDTVNFSPAACRATELDLQIASNIEAALEITNSTKSRETIFTELVKAREDISMLTAYQLLNKDMKLVGNANGDIKVGMPGYPISVQEFINKPDAKAAVETFSQELDCSVVFLIGMKITGSVVTRDIGVINIRNKELFNEILHKIKIYNNPNLMLEEILDSDFLGGRFFQQKNIRATRKHILPIVKSILESK